MGKRVKKRRALFPGRYYVVQFGDSFYSIAQKFNVTVDDILANNRHLNQHALFPGEILSIPVRQQPSQARTKKRRTNK